MSARYEITAPDGQKYEVTAPDGASEQEVMAYAQSQWKPTKISTGEKFKRGFVNDPVAGLQGLFAETETASLLVPEWAKNKRAELQKSEDAYQAKRTAAGETGVDWTRLGGNIVNPVNLAITAATKLPPGATIPARMLMSGAGGSVMSGVAPTYGDSTRAGQAGMGLVGGMVAAPVAAGLSRIVKPKVDPQLSMLRKAGVTPTIGQSMGGAWKSAEDKATSFPIMGDAIGMARSKGMNQFQQAAYNRALNPIGKKAGADVGFEGMANVHRELSNAYDDLLPKLSFKPDAQFKQSVGQLRAGLQSLDGRSRAIYDNTVKQVMGRATQQGNMSGETFKNVESSLGDEISKLVKDGSYEKGKVAEALMQFRDNLRQGLVRSNPSYAEQLKKINEGWANYAILRKAASGPQAAQTGKFTPAQLMQGVQASAKRSGQAVGQGKLSEGKALMQDLATAGQNMLPSKYPDSGTTGRMLQNVITNPIVGIPTMAAGMTVGGVGSLPYLPGVRQSLDLLMNARPQNAQVIADMIRYNPALFAPVAPSLVNNRD